MTKKLSRRSLLKMAAGLVASGAITWLPKKIDTEFEGLETLVNSGPIDAFVGVDPAVTGGDETVIVEFEQPFAPYFVDPEGLRELWDDQGQWIKGKGTLNPLGFDGMTLRKIKND